MLLKHFPVLLCFPFQFRFVCLFQLFSLILRPFRSNNRLTWSTTFWFRAAALDADGAAAGAAAGACQSTPEANLYWALSAIKILTSRSTSGLGTFEALKFLFDIKVKGDVKIF